MDIYFYRVLIDGKIVAQRMSLRHALIFTSALFYEYYKDEPSITIQAEPMVEDKVTE